MTYRRKCMLYALIGVGAAILLVLHVVLWTAFVKMGLPGVFGIIPGLNLYLLFKKAWSGKCFTAMVGCAIALVALHIPAVLTALKVKFKFNWLGDPSVINPGPWFRTLLILFGAALAVIMLVLIFGLCIEFSMKFGKKAVYGVGLFFLPFVFGPMLVFGKNKFVEKQADAVYVALGEDAINAPKSE